jgi:hypothetical protein
MTSKIECWEWERNLPLTRPATADENAVAVHPLPRGEGYDFDSTARPASWPERKRQKAAVLETGHAKGLRYAGFPRLRRDSR